MQLTHIEHIGIAVRDLSDAIPFFEKLLGTTCYGIEEVADQKVKTAFLRVGETKIELLESTTPDGPIGQFIDKRGEGVHHIALAVDGLSDALAALKKQGTKLVDTEPRIGAEGYDIAFLYPRAAHGVLIELCEKRSP
jgi:methylmalonyl-CoA/ethylmalonyl-CoA epimerase